ncbi:MAG: hypothetical protein JO286_01825 [Solirubrobacterales bacterium]|nr:hypothetical protein [Solirubrobacterales bacterium]
MSIILVAGEQELPSVERIDPALRPLLDHIAAELAQEYIRLMGAAADSEMVVASSAADA